VASYLQARHLPGRIFGLELIKLVCLVGGILSFGRTSPLATCAAVGIAFGIHAILSLWVVERVDQIPLMRSLASLAPALAACLPLVASVLLVRNGLAGGGGVSAVLSLVLEVLAGAAGYAAGAWLFARRASEDLLARLLEALRARREVA
jgi:PST family polysaccharide transporter